MDKRETVVTDDATAILVTEKGNKEKECKSQVIVPIISDSEVTGSVILIAKESGTKLGKNEEQIAKIAANFLGNQMEI